MKLSVIIPYYKDYSRLIQLLDCLKKQQLASDLFEVIVVNNDPGIPLKLPKDFSTKYSLLLLEEPRPGSYAARNKGIENAIGEIVAFTDSDCLPDTNWLSNALNIFTKDTEMKLGILTGPVPLFYKDPKKLTAAEVYEKYTGFTTEVYAKEGHAITANWFSYKKVIEEFNGFNSNLKSNGDTELSNKISRKYKIVFDDRLIVMHPARYRISEIVKKYRRLIGGVYVRKYLNRHLSFTFHIGDFFFRRIKFALKKLFTVPLFESLPIVWVCVRVNWDVFLEYWLLISGSESKR